ncbi:hypothetical protein NCS57_00449400 [Fusarium keratoplasticum]|uniref:Uncharacterized protein n=1 Tax=Fusarium keratoplasticum TaxID=1328300 RepID=A0ACC0R7E9_9HYPO|nr:hypothetical protein NCS57_00449400 [Fusarium keratoplasticum]KAI8675482.1 hypothetical protein NCS57_00449400 [Fusarium keratoplasticum]
MANSNALPQGFSVFQPTLGSQLQFFPAVGSRELDELVNAYIPGPASVQEKRASISLDFLEYAHLTGQTFKFYPVYSMATPAVSPATASPLQDSGYGSSFNASPVMSNWDWSQVNAAAAPSRRQSPKASSRHQTTDFSHLPGMKIMTRDGRDVTNSASRGSKTKEQRDHAHLMRIIKACDSCRRKKIRCDPSHKKRGVTQSQAQPASKVTKKTKTPAREARTSPVAAQPDFSASIGFPDVQALSTPELDNLLGIVPAENVAWEDFLEYPPVDDYDFFNDPEGYFSPQSSSVSAYSTKPVTPTSTQDQLVPYNTGNAVATVPSVDLPFNQTESTHDYVDFNLFSPESSFSEDERMVPIELSKQSVSQPRSPAPNPRPPIEPSGGSESSGGYLSGDLGAQSAPAWATSQELFGDGDIVLDRTYRDPGVGLERYSSSPSSSFDSDVLSHSVSSLETSASSAYTTDFQPSETPVSSAYTTDLQSSAGAMSPAESNVAISHNSIVDPTGDSLQSVTTFANASRPGAIGTSGLSQSAGGYSDYYDHSDCVDQERDRRREDVAAQSSDTSSCHVLTEHQRAEGVGITRSNALNSGSPVQQNRRRDVLELAPFTGANVERESAPAASMTQVKPQTPRAQLAVGEKEERSQLSSAFLGIAPVSTALASLLQPSSLTTFMSVVMIAVALAAWFCFSSVEMGPVDQKTLSTKGGSSSMSQARRLMANVKGKAHVTLSSRRAIGGTKSVDRMVSQSWSLIAV